MNIIVLAGGTSTERDISIVTGTMVCKALRANGHKATVVDVFLGYDKEYNNTNEVFNDNNDLDVYAELLKSKTKLIPMILEERTKLGTGFFGPKVLELCQASDIVFMGLHGANGEDGKIQGTFDLLGIKYTGTGCLSSALSMDKKLTKVVLTAAGIPMPKGLTLNKGNINNEGIAYPCVIKPCCGGSSVGVYITNNDKEYEKAVKEVFELEDTILVEEYIKGREFSIGVIDNKALPIIEIEPINGFYDYKNKYVAGMTKDTCPANLEEAIAKRMQQYAEEACRAVGLETYGRVDFLLGENDEIYCLEINTLPGMTPTSLLPQEAAAIGMNFNQLCEKLIEISMNKYN